MSSVLLVGGARSGKSAMAQRMAEERGGRVAVAVFGVRGTDAEFDARIDRHIIDRPQSWICIDATQDPEWLGRLTEFDVVVIDCVGTWLSLEALRGDYSCAESLVSHAVRSLASSDASVIFVSNEVGMSLAPLSELGRAHTDALGRINQTLSAACDHSYYVVAGRALPLDPCAITPDWS